MRPSLDSLRSRLQGVTSAIQHRIAGVRSHQLAILILIAHFILGVLYSVIVPIWEAYDELGHYAYVRYVATKHALPPPGERLIQLPFDERYQPPLYYLLGGLATFWVHTGEELELTLNPYTQSGQGGVNFFVHSDEEAFPYRGTVLAVHVTRLVSVSISTVVVVITYLIGRSIFPDRREIAIGAMAFNAFWPQFLFGGSVVTNDILVVLFSSLVVLFLVRILKQGGGLYDFLGLGLSLGAGLITKRNALAFLPLVILGLVIAAMGARRPWRSSRFWLGFLSALIVTSLVSGWWFVRNMSTYGQPIGAYHDYLLSFLSLLRRPLSEVKGLHWGILPQAVRYFSITIWASFGWGNVGVADWVHQLFLVTCLAGSLGLALFVARSDRTTNLALLMLLLDIFFVFAIPFYLFLVKGSITIVPGRYALAAVPALSLLLFRGLAQLVPQRLNKAAIAAFSLGIFLLALIIPFRFIAPAYARPPILSPADIEQIQYPLTVNFGDKMELLGYDLDMHNIKAGKPVPITLYWRSQAKMERNYTIAVQVLGPNQQPYGGWDSYPGRGNYATSLWKVGDIVRETYYLGISPDFPAPSYGQIFVALYLYATEEHLPVLDSEGHPISDSLIFGRFRVASSFPSEPSIENPVHFNVGNVAALIGYEIAPPAPPGNPMRVTLYWKALQDTDRDYTVFLHLEDEQGTLWGQQDGQPRNGTYPTSLWEEGEIIEDEHLIPLSRDAPAGEYRLVLGLYLLETMERLPIFDEDGARMLHDQIVIERVWAK